MRSWKVRWSSMPLNAGRCLRTLDLGAVALSPGLNMLNQAREFNQTVPLSGIILTKVSKGPRDRRLIREVNLCTTLVSTKRGAGCSMSAFPLYLKVDPQLFALCTC